MNIKEKKTKSNDRYTQNVNEIMIKKNVCRYNESSDMRLTK
jgi:hypothetical protein